MLYQSDVVGLLQRFMFLVAYAGCGMEAVMLYAGATAQQQAAAEVDVDLGAATDGSPGCR